MTKFAYLIPLLLVLCTGWAAKADPRTLYANTFSDTDLGQLPDCWKDLVDYRPARNWAVDGRGMLRTMMKEYVGEATDGDRKIRRDYLASFGMTYTSGVLVYDGLLTNDAKANQLRDVTVTTKFQKTPDDDVAAGLILRLKDVDNYYVARMREADQFEILSVVGGVKKVLAIYPTLSRMTDRDTWTMTFTAAGNTLSARLYDGSGVMQSMVDAVDEAFAEGATGLNATTFAGFADYRIEALEAGKIVRTQEQIDAGNAEAVAKKLEPAYPIVGPVRDMASGNTPFEKIGAEYDVVVAGAGTGGIGAALQAARMGARVLLLEETDCIGGQMANAGVTSMDEGGFWGKNTARERGIYREFHESAVIHYYSILKDPFTAYHFNRQSEGGFEPAVARAILYGLIDESRARQVNGRPIVIDLAVRSKVTAVKKTGETITGATVSEWTERGPRQKDVRCHILIDATEYGDVIPLTGARYRVGNTTSDNLDLTAPMQDHTWLAVMREYPHGIPEGLKMKTPPPSADYGENRFRNYTLSARSPLLPKDEGADKKRVWWYYFSWRGMPDSTSPSTGEMTEQRFTRCGFNGGNDYAVSAGTCEDPLQRNLDELAGINKTLSAIWYFQHVLGLPWSVADDQGYATPFQREKMRQRGVPEEFLEIAVNLPQLPYARESRRIIGVQTVRGDDIALRERGDMRCKHWDSSVAINDYSVDLHGTQDSIEAELDTVDYIVNTGPYEIPFGAFIPEKIDGFLPAEKNISQSRIVNGSTRLQPSTMTNGQAAGAMAALAVQKKIQPRQLNIIDVQSALLAAGDSLVPRWYEDVRWGTPLWQATQLLTLYGMMDRPGKLMEVGLLGREFRWAPDEMVEKKEVEATLQQLRKLVNDPSKIAALEKNGQTRGDFALAVAGVLKTNGRYFVTDQPRYSEPYDLTEAREERAKKSGKSQKKQKKEKKENRRDEASDGGNDSGLDRPGRLDAGRAAALCPAKLERGRGDVRRPRLRSQPHGWNGGLRRRNF